MQAKMRVEGDITVVSLVGRLAIEKTHQIKMAFEQNLNNKKVIFCLSELSFVGSSGIQTFFTLLEEFKKNSVMDIKLVGLHPDFLRVWTFAERVIPLHENVEQALMSYQNPEAAVEIKSTLDFTEEMDPQSDETH